MKGKRYRFRIKRERANCNGMAVAKSMVRGRV